MYLPEVVKVVAEARGQTEEHVAKITTANAERFFGLN
jgi:Tat protein secretion system quality control protein TatD with DNase activity